MGKELAVENRHQPDVINVGWVWRFTVSNKSRTTQEIRILEAERDTGVKMACYHSQVWQASSQGILVASTKVNSLP
jgi:hypothetical protein